MEEEVLEGGLEWGVFLDLKFMKGLLEIGCIGKVWEGICGVCFWYNVVDMYEDVGSRVYEGLMV